MPNPDDPSQTTKDATKLPGSIVVHPRVDPNMYYDDVSKLVIDRKSLDRFHMSRIDPVNRLYEMTMSNIAGQITNSYECRLATVVRPDGTSDHIYEVIWSIRGEDFVGKSIEQIRQGRVRSRDDDVNRLGSFLRARKLAIDGGRESGQTILVDRRHDDITGELK